MEIETVCRVSKQKCNKASLRIIVLKRQHVSHLYAATITQEVNQSWKEFYAARFESELETAAVMDHKEAVSGMDPLKSIYGDFYSFNENSASDSDGRQHENRHHVVMRRRCLESYLAKLNKHINNSV